MMEHEEAERWARKFHEVYERLAPVFGYETRTETREFDPTSKNGQLMIAVCSQVLVERDIEWWQELALVDSVAPEPKAVKAWLLTLADYERQDLDKVMTRIEKTVEGLQSFFANERRRMPLHPGAIGAISPDWKNRRKP